MNQSSGDITERRISSGNHNFYIFATGYSPLSNFNYSNFSVDGIRYNSMAQYLYAQQALSAHDYEAYQEIIEERYPSRCRQVIIRNLNRAAWNQIKRDIALDGLMAKFDQCEKAAQKLKSTGQDTIVFATRIDRIEGSGLDIDNDNNAVPSKWEGLNELGNQLEIIREKLNP